MIADSGSKWSVRVSNAGGTVTSADAVLTVTMPAVVVPGTISAVAADLGFVVAAHVDAEGNTLFARHEGGALDLRLVARTIAPDGTLLPNGIVAAEERTSPNVLFAPQGGSWGPVGSTYDAEGNLYFVANSWRGTGIINIAELTGGSISRAARDGTVTKLVEWPAGSADPMAPIGLAAGPDGTLYFLDQISGNLVAWTAQGGTRIVARLRLPQGTQYGPRTIFVPERASILVTPQNTLYVMDRNLLKRVDNGGVTVVAGTVAGTLPGGDTGYGPSTYALIDGTGTGAQFANGGHMALDAEGNILVADWATIRRVTPAGVVTTVAGIPPAAGTRRDLLPPLQTGALPGSLGLEVGPIAVGSDGVVRAFVNPDTASLPDGGSYQRGQQTLVTIRFE